MMAHGLVDVNYPMFIAIDLAYDNYEGFDAYQISTMPIFDVAPEIIARKKEIIYL